MRELLPSGRVVRDRSGLFLASMLCFGAAILAIVAALSAGGCGPLTPAVASELEAAAAIACSEEAMIPVAGPVLAMACPAEVAGVDAAIQAETAPASTPSSAATSSRPTTSSPDAGAPMVQLVRRGGPGEAPLVAVGAMAPCSLQRAVQRRLLAAAPPTTLPRAPAVLPSAGAGKDGAL